MNRGLNREQNIFLIVFQPFSNVLISQRAGIPRIIHPISNLHKIDENSNV